MKYEPTPHAPEIGRRIRVLHDPRPGGTTAEGLHIVGEAGSMTTGIAPGLHGFGRTWWPDGGGLGWELTWEYVEDQAGDEAGDQGPKLVSWARVYEQDSDTADMNSHGQLLRVLREPEGYYVIKTDRWAFGSVDELVELLRRAIE